MPKRQSKAKSVQNTTPNPIVKFQAAGEQHAAQRPQTAEMMASLSPLALENEGGEELRLR